jgi:hypothetical protein
MDGKFFLKTPLQACILRVTPYQRRNACVSTFKTSNQNVAETTPATSTGQDDATGKQETPRGDVPGGGRCDVTYKET